MTFRGTEVRVLRVEVSGRIVAYKIAYADSEGMIHGTMDHSLTDLPDAVRKAAAALVTAITDHSLATHFEGVQKVETLRAATGIAESFRGTPDPAEDPDGQG